jgi:hypothetical protein
MGEWCRDRGNYSIETVRQTSVVEVRIESSREREREDGEEERRRRGKNLG